MHKATIIPLESWAYSNPELRTKGANTNIGLFAEALIYYDTVYVEIGNQECFLNFVKWFTSQGKLDTLLGLLQDGIIKIYDYEFISIAIEKNGVYGIWNLQGQDQTGENIFEKRYLYNRDIESILPSKARHRIKVYNAFRGNVVEVKPESFSSSVENARLDYLNPERNSINLQAFVNEVYRYRGLRNPPEIKVQNKLTKEGYNLIEWGINLSDLSRTAGTILRFNPGTPLTAFAHSNRIIWSAASLNVDLYLSSPLSSLVNDKLYESSSRLLKPEFIVESLQKEVNFPNIQDLVNYRKIGIDEILEIRKKAKPFRIWLQDESEKDRNAIFAYHNEVAKTSGFSNSTRRIVYISGLFGGAAIGGAIGSSVPGPLGGVIGGVVGTGVSFVTDIIAKYGEGWKPIIFGNWYESRIEEYLNKK
jgi:hypothetical protein